MNKKSSKIISSLRQQVFLLQKERNDLVWKLLNSLRTSSMIPATFSQIFKTCGKANCKCQKGEKHGPYPAIQIKINNNRTLKMIKQEDVTTIQKKTRAYKKYQDGLAKINKLNNKIHKLLQQARNENLEEYQ